MDGKSTLKASMRGENLSDAIEEETGLDLEETGDSLLESEFKRALEALRSKKPKGTDNIPPEFLKLLGEVATKRLLMLVCRMYESGDI